MVFVNDKDEQLGFAGGFMSVDNIARIGWATHREWEKIIGEQPKPEWNDLPQERRNELHDSVAWILNHSAASIAQQHDAWRAVRTTKPSSDEHQNMVPFDELPWSQQRKAWLWRHIVHAIVG